MALTQKDIEILNKIGINTGHETMPDTLSDEQMSDLEKKYDTSHPAANASYSSDKPRSTFSFLPQALGETAVGMAKELVSPFTRTASTLATVPSSLAGKPVSEEEGKDMGLFRPYGTKTEALSGAAQIGLTLAPEAEEARALLLAANEYMKGKLFFTSAKEIAKRQAAKVTSEVAKVTAENLAKQSKAEALAGRTLQPSEKQVTSGVAEKASEGLNLLPETRGKTTFKAQADAGDEVIGQLSKAVDTRLSADPTPRLPSALPPKDVAFTRVALDDMTKVYSEIRSPEDFARIKSLSEKFEREGLVPKEINDVAKEYGTTFKNKAFKPDLTPTTSWKGEGFENTRVGVKEAARNLMPDDITKELDTQISKVFATRDLFRNLETELTVLKNKTLPANLLQKLAGKLGTGIGLVKKYTGVNDFLKTALPFLASNDERLSVVELEKSLGKTLAQIRKLRELEGKELANELVKMAEEAAQKQSVVLKNMESLPEGAVPFSAYKGERPTYAEAERMAAIRKAEESDIARYQSESKKNKPIPYK